MYHLTRKPLDGLHSKTENEFEKKKKPFNVVVAAQQQQQSALFLRTWTQFSTYQI
jgi:hypothetical protein